jgi:malate dehydrogenase (oxaloacetate-decarboxylating)(NADP+)
MEGKAVLFKKFAKVNAVDIEVDTQDADELIKVVKLIGCSFGGVNLEGKD